MTTQDDEIVVTVTDEHWDKAIADVQHLIATREPVIIPYCCPIYQAMRERVGPEPSLFVGRGYVRVDNRYYCLNSSGIAITYAFCQQNMDKVIPLPVEVRMQDRDAQAP